MTDRPSETSDKATTRSAITTVEKSLSSPLKRPRRSFFGREMASKYTNIGGHRAPGAPNLEEGPSPSSSRGTNLGYQEANALPQQSSSKFHGEASLTGQNEFYSIQVSNFTSPFHPDVMIDGPETMLRTFDDSFGHTRSDTELGTFLQDQYGPLYEDSDSEIEYDTGESSTSPETTKVSSNRLFNMYKLPALNSLSCKDERLFRPLEYVQSLDTLAHNVFDLSFLNSVNGQFHTDKSRFSVSIEAPIHYKKVYNRGTTSLPLRLTQSAAREAKFGTIRQIRVVNHLYKEIMEDSQHITSKPFFDDKYLPLEVIWSRKIIHLVGRNIDLMQSSGYCSDIISVLVLDDTRSNVARLIPITCSTIFALLRSFESCLEMMANVWMKDDHYVGPSLCDILESNILPVCRSILELFGLVEVTVTINMSPAEIIRTTVCVLDIVVLCYVTAHMPDTSHTKLWSRFPERIVLPVLDSNTSSESALIFEPRRFLCLNDFLGKSAAWVCQLSNLATSERTPPHSSLYLSTTADTFADIWGPMWRCYSIINSENISTYRVGNGVILPWRYESIGNAQDLSQPLSFEQRFTVNTGEILCHWMSDRDYNNDLEAGNVTDRLLSKDDILLIGARKTLAANPDCERNTNTITESLKHSKLCKIAGTIKRKRVLESETVTVQVGGGVAQFVAGTERQYKIRQRTWKQVMVESWRNDPVKRNPELLQYRVGVEVSVCTQHARRQKLITILGSSTMQNYLKTLSLNWTYTGCRNAFFAALNSPDPTAFQKVWDSNKDWQLDMGNAISYCLESLEQTGLVENGLETFWMSKKGPQYLITLPQQSHSWAGFLKDSSHSCSMVVLNDVCLEVNMKFARTCVESQSFREEATDGEMAKGLCIFETSFIVNPDRCPESIVSQRYRRIDGSPATYKKRWNTSNALDGEQFKFGENGNFRVAAALNSTQLLGTWKSSKKLSDVFNRDPKYDKEHLFDEEDGRELRPIDVFFVNRPSNLVLFKSGGLIHNPKSVQVTLRSGKDLASHTVCHPRGDLVAESISVQPLRSRS